MSAAEIEIVNPVPGAAVRDWMRAMSVAFLHDPDGSDRERRAILLQRAWEPERAWGARDGGRWVGTLRTETRRLTVPGVDGGTEELAVDAVTNVTVAATHRRRGLLSRMLTDSLRAARERGDALSILIAAEWPIYGRFGYAPAILAADYELRTSRRGAECPGDTSRIRTIERDEVARVAPGVWEAARRRRAGQLDRGEAWWQRYAGGDGYLASPQLPHNWLVHEGPDGPDGLLSWTSRGGDFGLIPPFGSVVVGDLVIASDAAYRDLWAYLCGLDLVDTVSLSVRPVDEPVRWLLADARTLVLTQQVDFVWARLLDVPAALAARRYAAPGDLVLDVHDAAAGGYAAGRYRLTADDEHAACEPTRAPADLELDQRVLASIYLGAFGLRELVVAGGVTERTPGALARAEVMFSVPLAPWNATWF